MKKCLFGVVEAGFHFWLRSFIFGQADTDGNAWIIGKSGYAPTDGWPSYVLLGACHSRRFDPAGPWVFSHWFPEGFL